jgi:branched-chain amino acid transport system substrate-binding protein
LRREGMGSIVFSTHALLDENSSGTGEFARAYRAEYGIAPENAFSALGYDTVKLLSGAINRSGSTDPAAILLALENTSGFKGVTGEISYLEHGHIPNKDVTMILLYDQEIAASEILAPSKPAFSTGSAIKETGQ